ncbi:MAG: FAD-dependent monooxygenase, partial [Pseudomonadota bacterium]
RVLERAAALEEVGAGVQLGPNGVKVLDALGLGAELRDRGDPATAVHLVASETGRRFATIDFTRVAERRWGAPMIQIHRADLHSLLLEACRAVGISVDTGRRVQVEEVSDERVTLVSDEGESWETSLAIGADGLGSLARGVVAAQHRPDFTGHIAWRAMIPSEVAPSALMDKTVVACGAGAHTVTYPLRGRTLLNIVAVEEGAERLPEDWSNEGDPDALRARFAAWPEDIRTALEAVKQVRRWPLYGHGPLPRWSRGRLVLLGDACHPMLPYMAQGATMAIEDAWVLARALETYGPRDAFASYEQTRKPRTTRVQNTAQANGRVYHASGLRADGMRAALWAASAFTPGLLAQRFDWLYGWDVTTQ